MPGGEAARRAIAWLLAMQSKDGGWAASTSDNNWEILNHVPFGGSQGDARSDLRRHYRPRAGSAGAMGRGTGPHSRAGRRAVSHTDAGARRLVVRALGRGLHLRYVSNAEGFARGGLRRPRSGGAQSGGEWLRSIQNADGGWGESCASYDGRSFVAAASTPTQTGWAVLGLLAGGDMTSESVRRGIEYLIGITVRRRRLGGSIGHGNGFSACVLSAVSPLPGCLPVAGAGRIPEGNGRVQRGQVKPRMAGRRDPAGPSARGRWRLP